MSSFSGIELKGDKLYIGNAENHSLSLCVSKDDIRVLIISIANYRVIPELDSTYEPHGNKICAAIEKKWRKDKSYLETPEEQKAMCHQYLCTIAGYHIYGVFVHDCILQLQFTGKGSYSVNLFLPNYYSKSSSREDLIYSLIDYLSNS